jgi:poly-gamma-glutamate capsule biosynthesis protein CapA/YwtB (metallophosphatase superfamily)
MPQSKKLGLKTTSFLGQSLRLCVGTFAFAAVGWSSPAMASSNQCKSERLTLSAAGDIIIHQANYLEVMRSKDRFYSLFKKIKPLIQAADLSYANLEGATALGVNRQGKDLGDIGFNYDCQQAYCGTNFLFNYHPSLVGDLKKLGIDVISTANNHSMDRKSLGVDRSVESFRKYDMPFTGTRHSEKMSAPWHTVTSTKGWKIAWLACTDHVNGLPDPKNQVLLCSSSEVTRIIRRLSEDSSVDAVIVTPHWGPEYKQTPSKHQVHSAQRFVDAGATAIFGNHPHVLQKMQVMKSRSGKEVPVIYSLGNFVSGQDSLEKNLSAIFYLDLIKNNRNETEVASMSFVPIFRDVQATKDGYAFDLAPLEQFSRIHFFEKLEDRLKMTSTSVNRAETLAEELLSPARMVTAQKIQSRPANSSCP